MTNNKGKIHKRGPELGYDTVMCNRFAAPAYYSRGVSDKWKDVDCKTCLKTKGKKIKYFILQETPHAKP